MTKRVEITDGELTLILEALDDAAFYRDARSRVLVSAVKRAGRHRPPSSSPPAITGDPQAGDADVHQRKAQAYVALATKLRSGRR